MQIVICIVISIVVICITLYLNKLTAAKLYSEIVLDADKPTSPYSVSRERAENGAWGYCITKNGEIMYSGNNSRVFGSIKEALREINNLEAIQGYKKTRV